jgi:hypothetical protein
LCKFPGCGQIRTEAVAFVTEILIENSSDNGEYHEGEQILGTDVIIDNVDELSVQTGKCCAMLCCVVCDVLYCAVLC